LNFSNNIVCCSEASGCWARLEEKMTLLRRLAADADVRVAARKSQGQNELKAAQAPGATAKKMVIPCQSYKMI